MSAREYSKADSDASAPAHGGVPGDLSRVPEELRVRPQWVMYRLEKAEDRLNKIPYDPNTGRRASTRDLMTWGTFEQACDTVETGGYDGVGFVFSSGDPYVGIDLDKCRDPETGALEPWAEKAVRILGGYAEVSPSGRGSHVIVRGDAPCNGRCGQVEIYDSKRFFTVSGKAL